MANLKFDIDSEKLKDFLNNNLKYTSFDSGLLIIRIDGIYEKMVDDNLVGFGCMGHFKDLNRSINPTGTLYGKGFGVHEYPGSINIKTEGIMTFLRMSKLKQIKEKING